MKEEELYGAVKNQIKQQFLQHYNNCHLEITNRRFSDELKSKFDDLTFFQILSKEHTWPDITGFVKDTEGETRFIVLEIKNDRAKIKDFYQAKMYGEFFKAQYCFLVCTEPLPQILKRVIMSKDWIIQYVKRVKFTFDGPPKEYNFPGSVFFIQYNKEKGEVGEDSWFPKNPFTA